MMEQRKHFYYFRAENEHRLLQALIAAREGAAPGAKGVEDASGGAREEIRHTRRWKRSRGPP